MMAKKQEMKFLPLLSKEEKEALLDKKIEEMRRKNAAKEKRFREVEADKKAFESTVQQKSSATSPISQKPPHANGVSGGIKNRLGMGRGRRLEKMSKQKLHAPEYEAKKQQQQEEEEDGPGDGPPPDPGYRFLSDPSREGPLPRDPQKPPDHAFKRHPRNFGGDTDFKAIPSKVKQEKEKQSRQLARAPRSERDKELQMTGRERREYSEWKNERQKIDQDRIERHRKTTGEWKREWDSNKQDQGFTDAPVPPESQHTEPGRRPAGRIGSGRFDRGVRDEPRPVRVLTGGQAAQKDWREPHVGGDTSGTDRHVQWSPRRRPLSRDFDDVSGLDPEYKDGNPRKRVSLHGNSERPPLKSRLSQGSDDGRSVEEHNDSLIINVFMDSRTGFVSRSGTQKSPEGTGRPGFASRSDGQRTPEAVSRNAYSTGRAPPSPTSSPRKLRLKRPDRNSRLKNRDPRPRDPAQHEDATNWRKSAKGVHFEDWPSVRVPPVDVRMVDEKPRDTSRQAGSVKGEREERTSRVSPDTGDAHAWAERKTKTAHQKTRRHRRRSTNEDSGSDVHNSSAESLERFIEENTLHLDVHMDLPSLIPPSQDPLFSSPENIIKTPVGYEHVLDWSTVTPDDDIDVSDVVYGKRSPQEKPRGKVGMNRERQSRNREEVIDSASRKNREGKGHGEARGQGSIVDKEATKDAKKVESSTKGETSNGTRTKTNTCGHGKDKTVPDQSSDNSCTLKAPGKNGSIDCGSSAVSGEAAEVAAAVLNEIAEDAIAASGKAAQEGDEASSVTGNSVTEGLTDKTHAVTETSVSEAVDDVATGDVKDMSENEAKGEVAEKEKKGEVTEKEEKGEVTEKEEKGEVTEKEEKGEVNEKEEKGEVTEKVEKGEVNEKEEKGEVTEKEEKEEVTEKEEKEEVIEKEEKEEVNEKEEKGEVIGKEEKEEVTEKEEKGEVIGKEEKEEVTEKEEKGEVTEKVEEKEVTEKEKTAVAAEEEMGEKAAIEKEGVAEMAEKEEKEVAAKDTEEVTEKDGKDEVPAKEKNIEIDANKDKEEVTAVKKEDVAGKEEEVELDVKEEKQEETETEEKQEETETEEKHEETEKEEKQEETKKEEKQEETETEEKEQVSKKQMEEIVEKH